MSEVGLGIGSLLPAIKDRIGRDIGNRGIYLLGRFHHVPSSFDIHQESRARIGFANIKVRGGRSMDDNIRPEFGKSDTHFLSFRNIDLSASERENSVSAPEYLNEPMSEQPRRTSDRNSQGCHLPCVFSVRVTNSLPKPSHRSWP